MANYGERSSQPRPLVLVMLVLLILQFMSGMVTNLYVQIPDSVSNQPTQGREFYAVWGSALRWTLAHGSLFLRLHVILGVLLLLLSLVIMGSAIASRRGVWVLYSILGWLMTTGAAINGMFFLSYGQHNLNSLIMSFAFIGASAFYVIGYCVTRQTNRYPRWRY